MDVLLALLLLIAPAFAAEPAALLPPSPPARGKAAIETMTELTLDMSKTVMFLENGQAYFKAYGKGTHSPAENKAFVKFLEDYERELNNLKTENETLKTWIEKKSELKAP
ncbi:MAG: hypothetical protein HY077_02150 [Elusimicrobia bacterium]|nr:hypothetical protein [Elusimicrobiota bacterium]